VSKKEVNVIVDEIVEFHPEPIGDDRMLTLACEAIIVDIKGEGKRSMLSFGHSVKSTKDDRNDELGKHIASGRAQKNPIMTIIIEGEATVKLVEKFATVLEKDFRKRFSNYVKTGKQKSSIVEGTIRTVQQG
jgi:hypothetical protein